MVAALSQSCPRCYALTCALAIMTLSSVARAAPASSQLHQLVGRDAGPAAVAIWVSRRFLAFLLRGTSRCAVSWSGRTIHRRSPWRACTSGTSTRAKCVLPWTQHASEPGRAVAVVLDIPRYGQGHPPCRAIEWARFVPESHGPLDPDRSGVAHVAFGLLSALQPVPEC